MQAHSLSQRAGGWQVEQTQIIQSAVMDLRQTNVNMPLRRLQINV